MYSFHHSVSLNYIKQLRLKNSLCIFVGSQKMYDPSPISRVHGTDTWVRSSLLAISVWSWYIFYIMKFIDIQEFAVLRSFSGYENVNQLCSFTHIGQARLSGTSSVDIIQIQKTFSQWRVEDSTIWYLQTKPILGGFSSQIPRFLL